MRGPVLDTLIGRFRKPRGAKGLFGLGALIFAALAGLGVTACGPAVPPPGSVASYGQKPEQKIKVVQGGFAGSRVLVSVAGGGYRGLNKGITPELAKRLSGWRVLQVTYEPGTVNSGEAQVDAAFAWIAANPGWVGARSSQVRVAGESAGGQLALRSGLKNKAFAANKMYSLAGTTELDEWYNQWKSHAIGGTILQVTGCSGVAWASCASVRDGSPASHKRSGPQLFFVHGKDDGMVTPRMAAASARRYGSGSSAWLSSGNHLDAPFLNDAAALISAVG